MELGVVSFDEQKKKKTPKILGHRQERQAQKEPRSVVSQVSLGARRDVWGERDEGCKNLKGIGDDMETILHLMDRFHKHF